MSKIDLPGRHRLDAITSERGRHQIGTGGRLNFSMPGRHHRNPHLALRKKGLWGPLPASDVAIPFEMGVDAIKAFCNELYRVQLTVGMVTGGWRPAWE
jgi:hypothetical protein